MDCHTNLRQNTGTYISMNEMYEIHKAVLGNEHSAMNIEFIIQTLQLEVVRTFKIYNVVRRPCVATVIRY